MSLFFPSLLLTAFLVYHPGDGANAASEEPQPQDAQNEVIKLTDQGVEPLKISMKREDSIVFFLNETRDSLATIEIDFGKNSTHCSSSNMKIGDHGVISSSKPIGPADFASTCFHDSGAYTFRVLGLAGSAKPIQGEIVVE
jgi:hypothetical protein